MSGNEERNMYLKQKTLDYNYAENAYLCFLTLNARISRLMRSPATKVLPNGISKDIDDEQPQAPFIKLNILLALANSRRAKYITEEDDILTDAQYTALHHEWMHEDWQSWMDEKSQEEWCKRYRNRKENIKGNGLHVWTRTRFRTFMWQIAGSLELLQFFLYVPQSYQNFCIFHAIFSVFRGVWKEKGTTKHELLMTAVERVRLMTPWKVDRTVCFPCTSHDEPNRAE